MCPSLHNNLYNSACISLLAQCVHDRIIAVHVPYGAGTWEEAKFTL